MELVRQHIKASGQHVRRVSAGEKADEHAFMYTIGNHQHGLPELLLIGPTGAQFIDLLNYLGEIQRKLGRPFGHEELVELGAKFPVRIVDAGKEGREKYAVQIGVFYGTDEFEVRQVLLCDQHGRWPDDPDCDKPYCDAPILGRR